jgi:hypothetical protein
MAAIVAGVYMEGRKCVETREKLVKIALRLL